MNNNPPDRSPPNKPQRSADYYDKLERLNLLKSERKSTAMDEVFTVDDDDVQTTSSTAFPPTPAEVKAKMTADAAKLSILENDPFSAGHSQNADSAAMDIKNESFSKDAGLVSVQVPCDPSEFADQKQEESEMGNRNTQPASSEASIEPGPSTSSDEPKNNENNPEADADDSDDNAEYAEDGDEEMEDDEEAEPEDEDGIPLSAIAKLSDQDRTRLDKLKILNRALNKKIDELKAETPETEEESTELESQLNTYTINSQKTLDKIIELCKIDVDEYEDIESQIKPFRFKYSGDKYLDRVLTVLVQNSLKADSSATAKSPKKSASSLGITSFKDLTEKRVAAIITGIAKKLNNGKPGKRLLNRKTGRAIVAADVFQALHMAMRKYRARLFNYRVIPKYSEKGDRNPRLPDEDDGELREQLAEHGGRMLQDLVTDFAESFEDGKRKLGLPVERDADDNDVVEPSYSDSETDGEEDGSGEEGPLLEAMTDGEGQEDAGIQESVPPVPASDAQPSISAAQPSTSAAAAVEDMEVDDFNADELLENIV